MSHEQHPDNQPIPISWVSTDDLISRRTDLKALQETYWLAVNIILDDYFKKEG